MSFKKLLLSTLGVLTLFVANNSFATNLNQIEDQHGTENTVSFNHFTDARNLADLKGWGIETHKFASCATALPSNYQGISSIQNGYPFFTANCVQSKYQSENGGNAEAYSASNEHDFARARKCSGGGCGSWPANATFLNQPESGTIVHALKNQTKCSEMLGGVKKDVYTSNWTGGNCVVTLKKQNFNTFQKYYNNIGTLNAGDTFRVFTYLHNNAQQYTSSENGYEANKASNLNVTLDWSNNTNITSTIDSTQTSPILDNFNFAFADTNLQIKPIVNASNQVKLKRKGGQTAANVTYTSGNQLVIPMNKQYSSFGNTQRLYVDFEVVAAPAANLEITKHIEDLSGNIIAHENSILLADIVSTNNSSNPTATEFLQAQSFQIQDNVQINQATLEVNNVSAAPSTQEMLVGTEFVYVLTPKNTGNTNSGAFVVTDTLPNEVEFISFLDVPTGVTTSQSGQTITFNVLDLAAGSDMKLKIKVKLKEETPNLTNFCNKAFLSQAGIDTISSNNACLVSTIADPNILIKKSQYKENGTTMPSPTLMNVGEEFLYEIEIENNGPADTQSEVIVTDVLDANIEWVNNNGNSNIVYEAATHKVTINFGIMPSQTANRRSFKVKLKTDTPNGACHVKNTASFTYDDGDGSEFQSGTSNEVCVSVEDPTGFMKFEKWAKTAANAEWHKASEVEAGEVYEYRIMAFNNSTVTINNVIVTDPLDSNLTFVSSTDATVSHNGTNPGGIVTMNFGTMTPLTGDIRHFKVKVDENITAGTSIPNSIFDNKNYCDNDGDGTTDQSDDCDTVHTIKTGIDSEISIIKRQLEAVEPYKNIADKTQLEAGSTFIYELEISNNANTGTPNAVIVTDKLPEYIEFVENLGDDRIKYDQDSHTVIIDNGSMTPKTAVKRRFLVKIKEDAPEGDCHIVNVANLTIDDTKHGVDIQSNEVCIGVDNGGSNPTGKLEITKEAKTIANDEWHKSSAVDAEQDGGNDKNYLYKITVDNTYNSDQKSVTVTDNLDSRISFVEFVPYDSNNTKNTSSKDTSLISGTNPINFLIGTVPARGFKHVVFKVKVETTATKDSIPNVAKLLQNGKHIKDSNTTTHTVTGGGSSSSTPVDMTGICNYDARGGFSCKGAYPSWNPSDPAYNTYAACKKDADKSYDKLAAKQCLATWVADKGFTSCDSTKPADAQCKPEINVDFCVEEQGAVTINKKANKSYFTNGDEVNYTITVNVTPDKISKVSTHRALADPGQTAGIKNAWINVHDLIVPSDSGFVWGDRDNGLKDIQVQDENGTNSQILEVIHNGDYTKIPYELTSKELIKLKNNTSFTKVFTYTLKTELIEKSNTCEITNAAFATVKIQYTDNSNNSYIGSESTNGVKCADIKDGAEDWLYSEGDRAEAKIKIVRPFVETKSGNLCAEGVNGKTNGVDCAKLNASVPTATIDKKIGKAVASNTQTANKRLGEFSSTDSNNGIYFLNNIPFEWKNQDKTLDLGRSETFIINGKDLIISENLVSTSADYIPAFIVKGGNIIIAPGVTRIDGVFIALADENNGGEITSTGEYGTTTSKDQLVVSGNLIGDAKKLFISRRYIGEPNENGGEIKPSVKIVYDLRVFEQTPPGLNNFLGHNWKQEIE